MARSALRGHAIDTHTRALPRELIELIENPPLPTEWVSAVLSNCAQLVVADVYYPTEQAVYEWIHRRASKLSRSPMYSVLFRLNAPEHLMRLSTRFHGMFQKGVDAHTFVEGRSARVTTRHPPHLHGEHSHKCNVPLLVALLETAGARAPRVSLVRSSPEGAEYRCEW